MYQAILPSIHTPLIGVNILHLDCSIPTLSFWLLSFSLLRGLLPYLIFWGDCVDLLVFRFYSLEIFNNLQKSGILHQYFVLELLEVLQLFSLILLLHKLSLFSFLSCLGLHHLSCLLSSMLNVTGLYCLFQVGLELLLLFMPPLYFMSLLFKHIGIILWDIKGNGGRHGNTEKGKKISC